MGFLQIILGVLVAMVLWKVIEFLAKKAKTPTTHVEKLKKKLNE